MTSSSVSSISPQKALEKGLFYLSHPPSLSLSLSLSLSTPTPFRFEAYHDPSGRHAGRELVSLYDFLSALTLSLLALSFLAAL